MREKQRGFTIIEVVVVVAIIGLLAGTMAPFVRSFVDSQTLLKVKGELRDLARALDSHWKEYQTFPTSIAENESTFIKFLPPNQSQDSYDILEDDFNLSLQDTIYYEYSTTGTPTVATLYSYGINKLNDSAAEDDIVITVTSERMGREVTRKRLQVIAHALANYINSKKYVSNVDAWSLSTTASTAIGTDLRLDSSFAVDGFNKAWIIHSTNYRFYSIGPDGTDDSGGSAGAGAISDDDITF